MAINIISLPRLVELKLASGMTNPNRLKDVADVQEIIKTLKIDESFGENLSPYVRPKFIELARAAQAADPMEDY